MKVNDQTTLRELEDGLEKEGFTKLIQRVNGIHDVGNVKITRYEATLFKGEEWMDAEGGSVAEAISACLNRWYGMERRSGE